MTGAIFGAGPGGEQCFVLSASALVQLHPKRVSFLAHLRHDLILLICTLLQLGMRLLVVTDVSTAPFFLLGEQPSQLRIFLPQPLQIIVILWLRICPCVL